MSIFNQLHQLTQNTDALVELAENKEQALQGASDEQIRAVVEDVVADQNFATQADVIEYIESQDSQGLTEDEVIALINDHSSDGGLSEEEVLALIEANSTEGGVSVDQVRTIVGEETDLTEVKAQVAQLYERTNKLLDDLEKELSRKIGPSEISGDEHSNPGWGLHFSTEEPIHFGNAKVRALTSGTVNVELFEYSSGNVEQLADTTTVEIPTDGEQSIDLDIDVEEPGQYLLTRDWADQPNDFVSLWRSLDYGGWEEDSDDVLTLHGSGHSDFSDNRNWYYYFDLEVTSL